MVPSYRNQSIDLQFLYSSDIAFNWVNEMTSNEEQWNFIAKIHLNNVNKMYFKTWCIVTDNNSMTAISTTSKLMNVYNFS